MHIIVGKLIQIQSKMQTLYQLRYNTFKNPPMVDDPIELNADQISEIMGIHTESENKNIMNSNINHDMKYYLVHSIQTNISDKQQSDSQETKKNSIKKIIHDDDNFFSPNKSVIETQNSLEKCINDSHPKEPVEKYTKSNCSLATQQNINNREEYFNSVSVYHSNLLHSNHKRTYQATNLLSKEDNCNYFSEFKGKRLKKATDNKELKIDLNTTCVICLEDIKELANIDKCSHDFCKKCIIEWSSKYSNLCPLCKKEFKKIIYYDNNKKKEMKVKKKKLQVKEDEEEYYEASHECFLCGSRDDNADLLICTYCGVNACHTYCDPISLSEISVDNYRCPGCRDIRIFEESIRDVFQVNEDVAELNEVHNDDVFILLEGDDSNEPRRMLGRRRINQNITVNLPHSRNNNRRTNSRRRRR